MLNQGQKMRRLLMTSCCCVCLLTYWTSLQNNALPDIEDTQQTDIFDDRNHAYAKDELTSVSDNTRDSKAESNLKTIVFWNPWYHHKDYGFGLGRDPFLKNGCPETRCRTTTDHTQLPFADAVIVCGRLLNWTSDPVVPQRANPNQVFVYFNNEAPVKTLGLTARLQNVFNVTMTHRLDSTLPFPYSEIVPRTDLTDYRPVTIEDLKEKSKTNLISWMVSRCNKPGCVRHEYVESLNRHLHVDIYGRCGNLSCDRYDNGSCMTYQEKTYKFYLALENTVCEDYVTEKAFRTLGYNIVPIVMGGANYTKILPPHSFIDVRDFNTPDKLADYLKYLDQNDNEYLKYFDWKKDFEVRELKIHEPMCNLCDLLHNKSKYDLKMDFDLEEWWDKQAGEACLTNRNLPFLYNYFGIDPPAIPRTRGRGPKAHQKMELMERL